MKNQIQVIAPYWLHGTWLFDDPATDLVQEPFVSGVPEMIDDLVADIPDARQGFRQTSVQALFDSHWAIREIPQDKLDVSKIFLVTIQSSGMKGSHAKCDQSDPHPPLRRVQAGR